MRAVALVEPVLEEMADRYGLSLGDFRAVRVLSRLGDVPVSRFGSELGVPRSTITNLVDRLEKAGVVERLPDPADRRVTLVRLTPTGGQAVEALVLLQSSDVARGLFSLDEPSQAMLAELLDRVANAAAAATGAGVAESATQNQAKPAEGLEPVS